MLLTVGALTLAGCATRSSGGSYPSPRPLGNDIPTDRRARQDPSNATHVSHYDPTGEIMLKDALVLALMRSPSLRSYSLQVRASEAKALQEGLLPNPELELEIEEYDSEGTGFDTAETAIVLSQLVELGGKRRKRRAVADLESALVGWDYEAKRLDVFVDTTHAVIDVLAAQMRLSLATEAKDLAAKVTTAVGERVKAGKVAPLELSRAEVELSVSDVDLERAKKDLAVSRTQLAAMWGSPKPSFKQVSGDLEAVMATLPQIDAMAGDLAQNPDIARWQTELELRKSSVELEQSEIMPDLALSAGVQQFEATGEDALTFGVGVDLPLFDRNQGNRQAARHQLSKAKEQKLAAEVEVSSSLTAAYEELKASHLEALALDKKILPAAQRAFESVRDGYQQGKFGYLDVLDAQRTLFDVRAKHVDALSTYHKAVVTLERLIGRSISAEVTQTD